VAVHGLPNQRYHKFSLSPDTIKANIERARSKKQLSDASKMIDKLMSYHQELLQFKPDQYTLI